MSGMRARKAVIPAAGLGTRVLPATKAVPKEMMPLADRPAIEYIIEEAAASGIEALTIVTSRTKRAVEDHLDAAPELEAVLARKNDPARLSAIRHIETLARYSFVRQPHALGLGHAVLMARETIGNEPFGVMLPDDIVDAPQRPCLAQLLDAHQQVGGCVLAVMRVPLEHTAKYGVVSLASPDPVAPGLFRVRDLIEKPRPEAAPSNLVVIGRYVFAPGIFEAITRTQPGVGGEIQLTDAIRLLGEREPIWACEFSGTRYDTGDPVGLLTTSLAFALKRPDLAPGIRAFLRTIPRE